MVDFPIFNSFQNALVLDSGAIMNTKFWDKINVFNVPERYVRLPRRAGAVQPPELFDKIGVAGPLTVVVVVVDGAGDVVSCAAVGNLDGSPVGGAVGSGTGCGVGSAVAHG